MSRLHSFPLLFATVTLPLYALDQLTKYLTVRTLEYGEAVPVIDGVFDFVRLHNKGAAFSFLNTSAHSNLFFTGLSILAVGILSVLIWRGVFKTRLDTIACALLLAGILGNFTDRIFRGYVVDFLSFDLHIPFANPWPAFNIADSCICIAAILWIAMAFRGGKTDA